MKRATAKVAREIADMIETMKKIVQDESECGYAEHPLHKFHTKFIDGMQRWLLLLAPPPRKRRVKDPRTAKRRATVKELDALAREIVFERDGNECRKCGRTDRQLQWCHVYGRQLKWLRWDLDNSFCGCAHCHMNWWHVLPKEAMEWWQRELGTSRFRRLELLAAKPRKVDLGLVKAYLEGERGKL